MISGSETMLGRKIGFTLIELLVVISIIALLIAILLPALGAARRSALKTANTTQLRGMTQAMIIHGQDNKNWFPGLDARGNLVPDGPETLNSGMGGRIEARFAICVKNEYCPPEYGISPAGFEDEVPYKPSSGDPLNQENFSYAMSKITQLDVGPVPNFSPTDNEGRARNWNGENLNSQSVVIGDRTRDGFNGGGPYYSVWTNPPTDPAGSTWEGGLSWGDGHVTFEKQITVETQYTGGPFNNNDSIWDSNDGNPGAPDEATNNSYNAYLVSTGFQGTKDF